MAHRFLSRLAEAIFDQIPSDRAVFRALDGKGNRVFETSRGMDGMNGGGGPIREADETLVRRVLEINRPVLVTDLASEPLFADLELSRDGHPRSLLAYPWTLQGLPAGVAYLARNAAGRPFTRENMEVL